MELQRLCVTEPTHVARARRVGRSLALGVLGEAALDDLALVISELGSNILTHGGGGELLLGVEATGVEVLALDWGAGITDIRTSLIDGVSQRPGSLGPGSVGPGSVGPGSVGPGSVGPGSVGPGSVGMGLGGIGLGAVLRQSLKVELWSQEGLGSVIRARLGQPAATIGYTLAALHHQSCGDAMAWESTPWGRRVVAVDMAGQGADTAALAKQLATGVLGRWRLDPGRHLEELHLALRPKKLRASAVVIDLHRAGKVRVAGTADHRVWVDGVPCSLAQGTLGIAVDPSVVELPWAESVALCSDGVLVLPTQGSPALRSARALWGALARDDLSVGVLLKASL
ncbi:MAG: hypothetical protein ACI9VR_000291 [Cognaticolwellia sp.]|jgi:hypothetical protein